MKQKLSNGEQLLKEFEAFNGKSSKCNVAVTNKRLIASISKSGLNKMEYTKEVDVNNINSISTKYCRSISRIALLFVFVISMVLIFLGAKSGPMYLLGARLGAGIGVLLVGTIFVVLLAPKAGSIIITTKCAEQITFGISVDFKNSKRSKSVILPNAKLGKDFNALCEELGATIKEAQKEAQEKNEQKCDNVQILKSCS